MTRTATGATWGSGTPGAARQRGADLAVHAVCHSCRHVVGGRLRHFSKHPVRYRMWTWVSTQNESHARYAWLSLFSVAIADFYVYLLATGTITDPRFF